MLNGENQKREELGSRLEDIFRTRFYRYLFVTGGPNVEFGEVAKVIDAAAAKVDYVAIVTPSVMKKATYREDGTCLDSNLPADYNGHSVRQQLRKESGRSDADSALLKMFWAVVSCNGQKRRRGAESSPHRPPFCACL